MAAALHVNQLLWAQKAKKEWVGGVVVCFEKQGDDGAGDKKNDGGGEKYETFRISFFPVCVPIILVHTYQVHDINSNSTGVLLRKKLGGATIYIYGSPTFTAVWFLLEEDLSFATARQQVITCIRITCMWCLIVPPRDQQTTCTAKKSQPAVLGT